jgi:hypothetical protein
MLLNIIILLCTSIVVSTSACQRDATEVRISSRRRRITLLAGEECEDQRLTIQCFQASTFRRVATALKFRPEPAGHAEVNQPCLPSLRIILLGLLSRC